ncbi:hypothetical protein V5O48_014767 [Marasmius crinis-equi]|uniref:CxC2-like cysteine cluster KDZ transposase-associated domain-containing protein n=1 Tax=Marasmius crinis-equi TaxID=585013 RepID=A0ABR3EWC2_9AGAR
MSQLRASSSASNNTQKKRKKADKDTLSIRCFDFSQKTPLTNDTSSSSYLESEIYSADGRRVQRRRLAIEPEDKPGDNRVHGGFESPFQSFESLPFFESPFILPDEDELLDRMDNLALDESQKKLARKSASSAQPMVEWQAVASVFLDEMMALEGHGFRSSCTCMSCGGKEALYRCQECSVNARYCKECVVRVHGTRPFDIVQYWNGRFWEDKTLGSLGLVVTLGHLPGEVCQAAHRTRIGFTVVDLNGIQDVFMTHCFCQSDAGHLWQQLLRVQLYPATVNETATAFTFRTLSFFHTLTLQGKVNLYDFYKSLEKVTDGSGTVHVKDHYEAFIRVVRQWRYLKQMKRSGVGCEPNHLASTCRLGGEMYQKIYSMYLYKKFIAVDACFRLKRRLVSSEKKDPGLLTGLAYFVDQPTFRSWVPIEIEEENDCPGLRAIDQANTKLSKGYAQTGAILCLCSRHEIVEPNGTVDTKKGEKYCLTDYAIGASQRLSDEFLNRVLSYDICCQYCRRFSERMMLLPEDTRMKIDPRRWQYAVPKLHIQGHIRKCQEEFAFHLLPGTGQTDGEGIERHWASLGPVATSTKETGPGHRRDILDDHFGHWNHDKVVGTGPLLRKRRQNAREQSEAHRIEFELFNGSQDPQVVAEWRKAVLDWESGLSTKNPYAVERSVTTESDVRLAYATEEAAELLKGYPPLHDVSPSAFMQLGFHIEDLQRQLSLNLKTEHFNTANQQKNLVDDRGRIHREVARLRGLQQVYTPLAIAALNADLQREGDDADARIQELGDRRAKGGAEVERLYMPSDLPEEMRAAADMEKWREMEIRFRRAQLETSLEGIRTHLFIRSRLHTQRSLHVRHQNASTRSRDGMQRNDRKIEAFKIKYRKAWSALNALCGEVSMPELQDKDITSFDDIDTHALKNRRKVLGTKKGRGSQAVITAAGSRLQPDALIRPGESRKVLSWIWRDVDTSSDSAAMREALRIEWLKSWARKRRWEEELGLVDEEMRRTVVTLLYEAGFWRSYQQQAAEVHISVFEGIVAYAEEQACIREALAHNFQSLWARPDPPPRPPPAPKAPESDSDLSDDGEEEQSDEEGAASDGSNE